jgi:hypothetical protein
MRRALCLFQSSSLQMADRKSTLTLGNKLTNWKSSDVSPTEPSLLCWKNRRYNHDTAKEQARRGKSIVMLPATANRIGRSARRSAETQKNVKGSCCMQKDGKTPRQKFGGERKASVGTFWAVRIK